SCEYLFLQAEDGIRGFHVTGVQTCALPISGEPARLITASTPVTAAGSKPSAGCQLNSSAPVARRRTSRTTWWPSARRRSASREPDRKNDEPGSRRRLPHRP